MYFFPTMAPNNVGQANTFATHTTKYDNKNLSIDIVGGIMAVLKRGSPMASFYCSRKAPRPQIHRRFLMYRQFYTTFRLISTQKIIIWQKEHPQSAVLLCFMCLCFFQISLKNERSASFTILVLSPLRLHRLFNSSIKSEWIQYVCRWCVVSKSPFPFTFSFT